ncbi:hypothetical protein SELMODRAFT_411067 [Selaginella moellendorffii]|uniref:Uncharacterized protein n=1 Tax=Selaginella moellendorffii TaxID=88036 RepID=D8RGH3_SELML|nr:hypothetical protein SELMODRAFT_411067 [Selaginella moellendorffii]
MWKKHRGRMASMPLFLPLLGHPKCPRWFRDAANVHGKMKEGIYNVYVHSNGYTLPMFLSDLSKDQQLCTAFVCENNDVVREFEFQLPDGKTVSVLCTDQHQLTEDAMLKSGVRDPALAHCIPMQLHFLYRNRGQWPTAFWNGSMGTIIIDIESASKELYLDGIQESSRWYTSDNGRGVFSLFWPMALRAVHLSTVVLWADIQRRDGVPRGEMHIERCIDYDE